MRRLTTAAALAFSVIACPAPAHAEYTTPEQTGHGSGSFEVCVTPTAPGPWTYVIAARDPRIIRVPKDSWLMGRTDGSWVRAVAVDGRARITTTVPLSGTVGDTVKVRKPGTDDTADLRFVAVKQPACVTPTPTPTPTPTETPTWTASPTPTPTRSTTSPSTSATSSHSPTGSPTPTTSPTKRAGSTPSQTTSKACSTSTASPRAERSCSASSAAELANTGSGGALLTLAAALILLGVGIAVYPRGRRH